VLKIERFRKKLQSEIAYCATCQPWEDGEPFWILGDKIELTDLMDYYDVPEDDDFREELANELHCEGCGTDLNLYDDVGIRTKEEKKIAGTWKFWNKNYRPRIEEFGKFLEKNPYLGLNHKIGKEIFRSINKYPSINILKETWWRTRKPDGSKAFTSNDMYPPSNPEKEGRFNHFGQGAFYLALSQQTAAEEVLEENEALVWIQQFEIIEIKNILDLSSYDLSSSIPSDKEIPILALGLNMVLPQMIPNKDSPWKPEYFIPRFISDCAKHHGFKGIKFKSSKTYSDNIVLFDWEKKSIKPIENPKIIVFKKEKKEKGWKEISL